MKGIIIYKSKYGSTKQFAEWLKKYSGFELYDFSKSPKDLSKYDFIVIGSSVYSCFVSLRKFLIDNWNFIKYKKVALMLTSGNGDNNAIKEVIGRSFPLDISNKIKVFPVGGRYLFDKMSFFDRNLIKVFASFIKNPATKKTVLTERNDVRPESLRPLLRFLALKNVRKKNNEIN